MGTSEAVRRRAVLLGALAVIALAAFLPYLAVLDAPFVFDDVKLVKENRFLRPGETTARDLLGFFDVTSRRWDQEDVRPNYRPVRFLSYFLDAQLTRLWFGDFPADPPVFFFHLTNVLLHAANSLLVCLALIRILQGPQRQAGVTALSRDSTSRDAIAVSIWPSLLFALHPLQTEAVAYISGRRDVLSACFFLLAANVYLRAGPKVGALRTAVLAALLALGYLSKEVALTLPAILLALDFARGVSWTPSRIAALSLLWIEALAFAGLTFATPGLISAHPAGGFLSAVLTAPRYALRYLRLAVFPYPQSIDYSYEAIPVSESPFVPWTTIPAAATFLALVLGACVLCWKSRGQVQGTLLGAGAVWFFAALVPVLQLIPSAEVFAERFAYLPLAGLVLASAYGFFRLRSFEPISPHILGALLCAVALAATVRRVRDWETPLELWTSAVRAQPRAGRAHIARAHELRSASRLREAAEEYTRGIEILQKRPDVPLHHGYILHALAFRAETLARLGDEDPQFLDKAVEDYRRLLSMKDVDGTAIESSPRHTVLHQQLAAVLLRQKRLPEARAEYQRILEIGKPPQFVSAAYYYLGKISLLEGDTRSAAALLRNAYSSIDPSDPLRYQVAAEAADVLILRKEHREALELLDEALAAGAGPPERYHLLRRKAEALDRLGDLSGSMELLDRIIGENPKYGAALVSLGRIEANLGHFDRAESRFLAVQPGDPQYSEAVEELRALRVRKMLRGPRADQPEDMPEAAVQVLIALRDKGLRHVAREEWIAARESFVGLVARARAAGRRDLEAEGLRELARVEEKLSRYEQAKELLESAAVLDDAHAETFRRLGDLYLRRFDDKVSARQAYERYLAALGPGEPPDPKVLVNLSELVRTESPGLAVAYLERAKSLGADPAFVDWKLGYLYAEQGEWAQSLKAFERYLATPEAADDRIREDARRFIRERVIPALEATGGVDPSRTSPKRQ